MRSPAAMPARRIPPDSILLGFGPMLPLAVAGVAVWLLPTGWAVLAIQCATIWGALVLAFIGGVRRGFGFARPEASTASEIAAAVAYFTIAGLALVVTLAAVALALLATGFALAAFFDRRAALSGNAPAFFARLRPPQLLLGCAGLASCWAWLMS